MSLRNESRLILIILLTVAGGGLFVAGGSCLVEAAAIQPSTTFATMPAAVDPQIGTVVDVELSGGYQVVDTHGPDQFVFVAGPEATIAAGWPYRLVVFRFSYDELVFSISSGKSGPTWLGARINSTVHLTTFGYLHLITIVLAIVGLLASRHRAEKADTCRGCGYDRLALEGRPCPECGERGIGRAIDPALRNSAS